MHLTPITCRQFILCAALSVGGCSSIFGPTTPMPVGSAPPARAPAAVADDSQPAGQQAMAGFAQKAMGPGGGWLIGSTRQNLTANRCDLAARASHDAEERPAQPADVPKSDTADLNHDGFVTLDEIIAMNRTLKPDQMLERIRHFDGEFCLTRTQRQYLLTRGVPAAVVESMIQPTPVVAKASPAN